MKSAKHANKDSGNVTYSADVSMERFVAVMEKNRTGYA